MPLQIVTRPAAEPLHLNEAIVHINQAVGIDDAHILATVAFARQTAENRTWRQFVAARYRQVLDSFPGLGQFGVPWGQTFGIPRNAILLERAPVLAVESIQYLDMAGVPQTLDPALYTVDLSSEPCRITPKFGQIWPVPLPQIGAVNVTFTAGFAAPIIADATADTLTVRLWPTLAVGATMRFSNSGGVLPAPLQAQIDYYVAAVPSVGVYQLAATPGGAVIDLTDVGSGTHFLGEIPADLLGWMKLRLGSLDVFREDVVAMPRGNLVPLPFVDSLLDGYAPWW